MAAYTTVNKATDYFNTVTYTGTHSSSGAQSITGVGFQPDWVWLKNRDSNGYDNRTYDAVRTATKILNINNTNAEGTDSQGLTAFGTDGFTVGTGNGDNNNGDSYVGWNWKANGQGSSNTDGSINTTYTSVNTTAGFSISQYTGTGSSATIGHGLGVAPKIVIVKRLNNADGWQVYVDGLSSVNHYLRLDTTAGEASDSSRFGAAPTASVFSVGTANGTNASGDTYIAYCFAEKRGYSKFGTYTGNGSADGTFIYTGFKPACVIYKGVAGANAVDNWEMVDNKRSTYNGVENVLYPNLANAEGTGVVTRMDLLSNGFKMRTSGNDYNGSGQTYVFWAWAESTLVDSTGKIVATAR